MKIDSRTELKKNMAAMIWEFYFFVDCCRFSNTWCEFSLQLNCRQEKLCVLMMRHQ